MKHHKASEAMREAAAKVADRRANYAFSNCDRMGGADPETGVAECSLESRGQDCRCQQIEEDAENMAAAIRALPLPSATKAGEWRPIETAPKDGEPVLIACDRTGSIRWAVWSGGMWRDGQVVAGGRASGVPKPTHWQPLPLPPTPKEPGL